jgi:hypothetical protein
LEDNNGLVAGGPSRTNQCASVVVTQFETAEQQMFESPLTLAITADG